MARNPFVLGLVGGDDLCDRRRELDELAGHARNHHNVILVSPRQYGKSSLVLAMQEQLRASGFVGVYVDLLTVASDDDVARKLAAAVVAGVGRGADPIGLGKRISGLFARIVPTIEFGPDGPSVAVTIAQGSDPTLVLADVLDSLQKYVRRHGLSACVVLDEVQEIGRLPGARTIEAILRTHLQEHRDIPVFFVGSRRQALTEMFAHARPLYQAGYLYPLDRISRADFVPYITGRFAASGKKCSDETAGHIYDRVEGYPAYVQRLASSAWDLTSALCTKEKVDEAYRGLLALAGVEHGATWMALPLGQRALLQALAVEPIVQLTSADYLRRHGLVASSVQRAIKPLLEMDLVEHASESGRFFVVDPLMAAWVRWSPVVQLQKAGGGKA